MLKHFEKINERLSKSVVESFTRESFSIKVSLLFSRQTNGILRELRYGISHFPYNPDLATSDFSLFQNRKNIFEWYKV